MATVNEVAKNGRFRAMVERFTQKIIESLPAQDKPYIVRDDEIRGLVVKIYPTGAKTFFLNVKVGRTSEMFKLGVFPDLNVAQVREKAKKTRGDLAQGKNPKAEKREGITVGEFFEVYMERHGDLKKSKANDKNSFNKYLKPWSTQPLQGISRSKVELLHRNVGKDMPVQANRVLALLSTMFSKAMVWGYFKGENPCRGIKKFREISRDRFLSGEELGRFFDALEIAENPDFRDFILLCLLSGARKANVLSMRWKDIDFERSVWKIPGEVSKNGEPMQIPLLADALEILKRRRAGTSSVFVLEGPGKKGHYMEPKRAWGTLLKRAKLENLRIHDLRRSMGSWMTIQGASLPIVGKALGHKTSQATSIYARLNLDPVRIAMEKAAEGMLGMRKSKS